MNITYSSALTDVINVNPSFDGGTLRIAYTGRNRNNTFISKESFERAIPTMFNCPVVANYMREDDEIGSHDSEFVKDKNGETVLVNKTEPVGLVPESAKWYWENIEDNGEIHQYLCTDILLWKRQEAYSKIKENGITKQSMEIEVTDGEMLDDYYNIKDFCFTAFCLLGTAEPCFESAALFTFSENDKEFDEFREQYTEMLKEFKLAFASADDITKKEGEENLKLKELLEKYSVEESDLDFEVKDLSDDELEAKFAEKFEAGDPEDPEDDNDPVPENNPDPDEPDADDDEGEGADDGDDSGETFELNSNFVESLRAAIYEEQIDTDWGGYSRRWMVDYDVDANEVYFYDNQDDKLYGCKYTLDGDDVRVDFDNAIRKKYAIVDYEEGTEQNFALSDLINTFNEKYTLATVDRKEFDRLKEFEKKELLKNREAAEKELFDKFENKLKDDEDYKALKDKAPEYELDDLEKELFALIGKINFALEEKNAKAPTPAIIPQSNGNDDADASMRALFSKAGVNPIEKENK